MPTLWCCVSVRALERAAARVCREAGATVQQHVLLWDLNVELGRLDERRIEVIANGLLPRACCVPPLPSHNPWHRSRWPVELRSIHLRTPARALPRSRCASPFSCSLHLRSRTSLVGRVVHRSCRAFAASLLGLSLAGAGNVDGNLPLMSDLPADSSEVPLLASRMPQWALSCRWTCGFRGPPCRSHSP